ncbi:MAG: bifunctional diguanylate cyclase/phosphodiesterase, partial [Sulfurospirillaceae bacterium]|nr:bifunctional diguanylate cyclase/phosphodiesterase [Sulfurospirillaceae bacterium]
MRNKGDKISKRILFTPLIFMVTLLLIAAIATVIYNNLEYSRNVAFATKTYQNLADHGMSEISRNENLYEHTKHLIRIAHDRTIYDLGLALFILVSSAFFIYFIFRKTVYQALQYQKELHNDREKIEVMSQELRQANERLEYQLYSDALTKLDNRRAIERDITLMEDPKLILLDIDSFKDINEYYGNGAGDFVLNEVTFRLKGFAKKHLLHVYRVGADEFALLENAPLDVERYEELAVELVDIFKGCVIDLPSHSSSIEINVAIGFSLESDDIYEKASMALSEAKKREIDYLCYFRKIERTTLFAEQIKWSQFIKEAIANDTVIPYYQPIFNNKGEIIKYECLIRILNEKEEAIPPGLFLAISKKVKKYSDIEKMLIDKSFKEVTGTNTVISVNLLARDMSDSNVSNYVIEKLHEYKVSKQVVFEILEDESIENLERVENFIDRVKRMGCKIAIDDFGTGYSNFSYLLKLKPDYIKIDGSLIKHLDTDTKSVAIVSAIITFARKLGIQTIAEYVHNERVHTI